MLILKKELFEQILRQCIKEFPDEGCGILAGRNGRVDRIYEMTNSEKSPSNFFMEPKEQLRAMKEIRAQGLQLLGIYHSHVASEAYPSSRDVELAFYPEASYVILSLKDKNNPSIRSFNLKEGSITEEEIKIE